jgi:hypothetical protein
LQDRWHFIEKFLVILRLPFEPLPFSLRIGVEEASGLLCSVPDSYSIGLLPQKDKDDLLNIVKSLLG